MDLAVGIVDARGRVGAEFLEDSGFAESNRAPVEDRFYSVCILWAVVTDVAKHRGELSGHQLGQDRPGVCFVSGLLQFTLGTHLLRFGTGGVEGFLESVEFLAEILGRFFGNTSASTGDSSV